MKLPFAARREAIFASHETFFRGLTLGALIGAAIAGSTLWSRLRRSSQAQADDSPHGEASG